MAVVDLNPNNYVNADGLNQYFGLGEAVVTRGGEFEMTDGKHLTEVFIDLPTISASLSNEYIVADNVTIPAGALIEKVELMVTEVTAGSSSTLDLGLVDQDRTTEIDFDGFIVNGTTTWHTAAIGTIVEYVQGSTEHGALIGEVLTNTGLITASVDTAAFTDGVVRIRIYWSVPLAADL
jgi:hypothetical protein